VERYFLQSLPGYRGLKNLIGALRRSSAAFAVKAAAVVLPDGSRQLGYVAEDNGGPNVTCILSSSGAPMAGTIRLVPREKIEILNVKRTGILHGRRWQIDSWSEGRRYIVESDELLTAFLEMEKQRKAFSSTRSSL
jgi:hypothetical protein